MTTVDDRQVGVVDVREPNGRGRRWLVALLAAATVAALAVSATVIAKTVFRPDHKAPLRFTAAPTWRGITPGWSIALWSPGGESLRVTVFLISPTGLHRTIAELNSAPGAAQIGDWSEDRTKVAITPGYYGPGPVYILDLRTRAITSFRLKEGAGYQGFLTPDGSQSVITYGPQMQRAQVVDVHGKVLAERRVRPTDPSQDSQLSGGGFVAWVNGQRVVLTHGRRATTVIRGEDGRPIATLTGPPGVKSCAPIKPWTAASLLEMCGRGSMWSVRLDNGPATLISKPDPGIRQRNGQVDYVYFLSDVFRVDGSVYGYEAPSCGPTGTFVRIGVDRLPHPIGLYGSEVGATANTIYYRQINKGGCAEARYSYYSYDPATRVRTALLGAGVNGGTVLDERVNELP